MYNQREKEMALTGILPIGQPIISTPPFFIGDRRVTETYNIWDNADTLTLGADVYRGKAQIQLNGALQTLFKNIEYDLGIPPLYGDGNVSIKAKRTTLPQPSEDIWITRGIDAPPLNKFLYSRPPIYYEGYPIPIVGTFYRTTKNRASIVIDDALVEITPKILVFKADCYDDGWQKITLGTIAGQETWEAKSASEQIADTTSIQSDTLLRNYIEDRTCIPEHPFYVKWINRWGGYDMWMFRTKQRRTIKVDERATYEAMNRGGERHLLSQSVSEQITTSTGLITRQDWEMLQYMLQSPQIQVWNYDEYHDGWSEIHITKGAKGQWDSDQEIGEMIITFDMPTPKTII